MTKFPFLISLLLLASCASTPIAEPGAPGGSQAQANAPVGAVSSPETASPRTAAPKVDMQVFSGDWTYELSYNDPDLTYRPVGKVTWDKVEVGGSVTTAHGRRFDCRDLVDLTKCTEDGTATVTFDGNELHLEMTHTETGTGDPDATLEMVPYFIGADDDGTIQEGRLAGSGTIDTRSPDSGARFVMVRRSE